MDILKNIQYDDLTEDLKLIADIGGLEVAIRMIDELNGVTIYIPRISRLTSFIKRYTKENCKNHSIKQIARDLKVSEQLIKQFYYGK